MDKAIKVGLIFETFTYGGSETETIELVKHVNPNLIQFTGIAVHKELMLPAHEPTKDGSFPKLYMERAKSPRNQNRLDPRIEIVDSFNTAVQIVAEAADVIICWGVQGIQKILKKDIPVIILSKASGTWTERFCHPNSLMTNHLVGNSTMAATAFPYPQKVHVIYDGINPERIKPTITKEEVKAAWGLNKNDKVVGFIGRIAKDKGVSKIVPAIKLLPLDWKVVFIGVNPNSAYANILELECQNQIPGRYKLLPWTVNVGNALAGFDVFCHPSDYEGFSNSLAEAWAAGVPTVYTEGTGALPDLGEMGVGVSLTPDPEELKEAILKSLTIDVKYAQNKILNEFSPQANADNWTKYIQKVYDTPKKPRVLIIYPNLVPGGATTCIFNLIKYSKHAIDWCGFVLNQHYELTSQELKDELNNLECPYFFTRCWAPKVLEAIELTKPDLLLVWGQKNLIPTIPTSVSTPIVMMSHGANEGDDMGSKWAVSVCQDAHRATGLVAVSDSAATAFPKHLRDKVKVIWNGVEKPKLNKRNEWRQKLGLNEKDIAIGYIGRLNHDKNPFDIAKAANALPDNYKAIFIGPENVPGIKNTLSSICNKSIFLGPLSHHEAIESYAAMDVIINTSLSEGFGLMVIESWLNRVPVVSTYVGIVKEYPDLVALVPPKCSTERLVSAIHKCLSDDFVKTIEDAYQTACQHFTADKMAEQWITYIKSLLSSQGK